MAYRERLWPAVWVWILMFGCAGMLAWALAFALGPAWGLTTLIVCALLIVLGVAVTLSNIAVTDTGICVDRVFLPRDSVRGVHALDSAQMRITLRTPPGPTFLGIRPWACREGVLLELDDPADPHTHWLLSSRHPLRLTEAILGSSATHDHDRLGPGREV